MGNQNTTEAVRRSSSDDSKRDKNRFNRVQDDPRDDDSTLIDINQNNSGRKKSGNQGRSIFCVGEEENTEINAIMKGFLKPESSAEAPEFGLTVDSAGLRPRAASTGRSTGGSPPSPRSIKRSPRSFKGSRKSPESETSDSRTENCLSFSPAQINLCRKAWASARQKGPLEPALTIFQHIFCLSREIRSVFGYSDHTMMNGEQTQQRFKEHAKVFTELMDDLLANLEQDHLITPRIMDLGRRHVYFRPKGFKTSYWDTFSKAMIDCTLGWGVKSNRNRETQVAWTKIVMYIIDKMKDGYQMEFKKIRKQKKLAAMMQKTAANANNGSASTSSSSTVINKSGYPIKIEVIDDNGFVENGDN